MASSTGAAARTFGEFDLLAGTSSEDHEALTIGCKFHLLDAPIGEHGICLRYCRKSPETQIAAIDIDDFNRKQERR